MQESTYTQTNIEPETTNIMCHNHTFGGLKCMTMVHSVGYDYVLNLGLPTLDIFVHEE